MPRYMIPAVPLHRVEDTIKRSRFIVTLGPVASPEEAHVFVDTIRNEFPDATHHCWAYLAGAAGDTAYVGMSDDGEPHGTAGRPMLNVLLHSGVGQVATVVTRYFGGIKLGTGGLVRAYAGMVQLGLENLELREKITPVSLEVVLDYSNITLFKRMLSEFEVAIVAEDYGADACFHISLPQENRQAFEEALQEMTSGLSLVSTLET
ncbi:MAG: YigZ family protein [Desulfoplanes sp.]|nr:YigZ family protein [Desulfoplanes sp.]MDD4649241.1 YigZ family protein [Desulfoplanes sp.]